MTILLPTLAGSLAAFCVWLAVRIVNRRERWTRWTALAMVAAPALYLAGFGPACWVSSRANMGASVVSTAYGWMVKQVPIPSAIANLADQYSRLGARSGWRWTCIMGSEEWKWFDVGDV
jgi:hypothetical protein